MSGAEHAYADTTSFGQGQDTRFRSRCSCGWLSHPRKTAWRANDDIDTHLGRGLAGQPSQQESLQPQLKQRK